MGTWSWVPLGRYLLYNWVKQIKKTTAAEVTQDDLGASDKRGLLNAWLFCDIVNEKIVELTECHDSCKIKINKKKTLVKSFINGDGGCYPRKIGVELR